MPKPICMRDLYYILIISCLSLFVLYQYFPYLKKLILRCKRPVQHALLAVSGQLQKAAAWLIKKAGIASDPRYRSLSAHVKADPQDPYIQLLQQCVQDADTKNIALTGPYGSGKSSILKSFQVTHPEYHYLNISLASFKENKEQPTPPPVPGSVKAEEANDAPKIASIEYSILQQLFYHVRHQQIPFSRFKRIKNLPGYVLLFRSVGLVCWAAAIAYLIWHEKIFTTAAVWKAYFTWPPDLFKALLLLFIVVGAFYVCYIILRLYNNSKFHKFNLTSGEVEIAPASDASILNRHLDELLYFFEATRYNVLIIEDLDRFDDPEVFVRLRELNNLLNYSRQVGRKISFIYALKDDVFRDEQRTKFFDYIIPVIPVIDHQNSAEKFSDRLTELEIDRSSIPPSFISDVSAYINDMRLLLNTVNEFQLYRSRLNTSPGSYGQLLAMMIFKNKFPKLFAQLHARKGLAYKVLTGKEKFVGTLSGELLERKAQLERQISIVGDTYFRDKKELRLAYLGRILEPLTDFGGYFYIDQNTHDLKTLSESDGLFTQFSKSTNIRYHKVNGYGQNTGTSFAALEKQVDPAINYQQREQEVTLRQQYKKDELQQALKKVQLQLDQIRAYRLVDIFAIRSLPELDPKLGTNTLLNYFVTNDYLNEDYTYYLSHFYPGSLTQRDYDFFFAVKEKRRLPFDTELKETAELINRLDVNDFGHVSILNIQLADALLAQPGAGNDRLAQFSTLFDPADTVAGAFIHDYLRLGKQGPAFMRLLANWSRFWVWVEGEDQLTSDTRREYLGMLLQQAPAEILTGLNQQDLLKQAIEEMPDFLTWCRAYLDPDKTKSIFSTLNVSFFLLDAQATQEPLFKDILENFWYQLNPMMVELIVTHFSELSDLPIKLRTQNLTTIMAADIQDLLDYVREYPGYYIDNVFNELPDNTQESEDAIEYLLKEEQVSLEKRRGVLEKSDLRLSTITKAPQELWPQVLQLSRVEATWDNLYPVYAAGKAVTAEMAAFMSLPENYEQIIETRLSEVPETEQKLLETFGLAVLLSPLITVAAKKQLLPELGFFYTDPDMSGLSREQVEVIVVADRLNFTADTLEFLQIKHSGLQLTYVENNLDEFFEALDTPESLALNAIDFQLLLSSPQLSAAQKETLIDHFDFSELARHSQLAQTIAGLLQIPDFKPGLEQPKLLIVFNCLDDNDVKKRLLLKYLSSLSETQTGQLLQHMREGFSELPQYNHPKLDKTPLNESLLAALQQKGYYVSTFPVKKGRLYVYTRSRPVE